MVPNQDRNALQLPRGVVDVQQVGYDLSLGFLIGLLQIGLDLESVLKPELRVLAQMVCHTDDCHGVKALI